MPNTGNDARLIEVALRKASFADADITVACDQGFDAMRRTILAIKRKSSGADVALLYFAGHDLGGPLR